MPQSGFIHRNRGLDDFFGAGQLVEDSGVISDLDGGFDTMTIVVLVEGAAVPFHPGDSHPDYQNLYLFGISPQRLPGNHRRVTLTYKGLHSRQPGGGTIPTDSRVGKFTHGISITEKVWSAGELEGTVAGLPAADYTVGVSDYRRTIKVAWVGSAPAVLPAFDRGSGYSSIPAFGNVNIGSAYNWIKKPMINYPYGWVPRDVTSEQLAPGVNLWLNSVMAVETPKFSPA